MTSFEICYYPLAALLVFLYVCWYGGVWKALFAAAFSVSGVYLLNRGAPALLYVGGRLLLTHPWLTLGGVVLLLVLQSLRRAKKNAPQVRRETMAGALFAPLGLLGDVIGAAAVWLVFIPLLFLPSIVV